MDAPHVVSLAHATIGPAVYPAGSGALLTNLPIPPGPLGGLSTFGAGGTVNVATGGTQMFMVATSYGGGFIGPLSLIRTSPGNFEIISEAGAADAGNRVMWICV